MIFLGATLGGLVSQGTVNFSLMPPSKFRDSAESALSSAGSVLWPFKRFRNKVDQRDFMTAGCAAGVAGAFGAPIGARRKRMDNCSLASRLRSRCRPLSVWRLRGACIVF
jgi:hypothetical protein